uniref:Transposable element P transposase n=1 Tax=Clytia hemisphaerica TaxID=252671 RepID=A0A7M5VCI7_9CNID
MKNANEFFEMLALYNVCEGNTRYQELVKKKVDKGSDLTFLDKQGKVAACIEAPGFNQIHPDKLTIRHVNCELISKDNIKCKVCADYGRKILSSMSSRAQKLPTTNHPNTPNIYLTRQQLENKAKTLQRDKRELQNEIRRLKTKVKKLMTNEAVALPDEWKEVIPAVFESNDAGFFPADTPQGILWEQQQKYASLKDKRGMRWHPLIIRWAISIFLKSPATYRHLKAGAFLNLPSETTLNAYSQFCSTNTGFDVKKIEQLLKEIKIDDCKDYEKNVALAFDEMHIKSGLVYDKGSGKLIGFTDLGDINTEIEKFEQQFAGSQERPLSTQILCFMVRGIYTHLNYPIGFFGTNGCRSDQIYNCAWEAVRVLEAVGLNVRAFISDGASSNRTFYAIHQLPDSSDQDAESNIHKDGTLYWCWNRFNVANKIYFFCDVPHLIKTARNNLENSHAHLCSRMLTLDGYELSWQHIIAVYEQDLIPDTKDEDGVAMRKLYKLSNEHIHLSPRLRMRVNLAAQVLSNSVALALDKQNLQSTTSTRKYIRKMDRFFDCLNGWSLFIGQRRNKDDLKPYFEVTDKRFKFLEDELLDFFSDWEKQVENLKGVPEEVKPKLMISRQTTNGIRITVHSFCSLAKHLLTEFPETYILPDKFNQDPVEENFSKQRMRCGGSDNPTMLQYSQNETKERKIMLLKSDILRVVTANTRGRIQPVQSADYDLNEPLPKRKK